MADQDPAQTYEQMLQGRYATNMPTQQSPGQAGQQPAYDPSTLNWGDPSSVRQASAAAWGITHPGTTEPTSNADYWVQHAGAMGQRGQQLGQQNYGWNRMLGQGAGGADVPQFGPFAGMGGGGGGGAWVPGQGVPGMGSFGGGTTSGQGGDLYNMLMGRAQQSLQVNPNDPIIRSQLEPYNAQNTRAARQYMSQVAEKEGANSNIASSGRAAAEKVGQMGASYQGQLMQNELNARRNEIQQALSGMQGFLTQEQSMQLQEELAQLQLAQQANQFQTQADFRVAGI